MGLFYWIGVGAAGLRRTRDRLSARCPRDPFGFAQAGSSLRWKAVPLTM